ncbi:MAG: class I SAM-dependent methyltransferase [Promethearchaeota archaeon]
MSLKKNERLAEFIIKEIDLNIGVILEGGCGEGQLTIPFTKRISQYINEFRIIAYDLSSEPYSGSLDVLKEKIQQESLENKIEIMEGDVRKIDKLKNKSIDFIYSNELFCELDRDGLEKCLKEFYRVLKPDGQMAHAEYAPIHENLAQKLFIEADTHSLETSLPKPEWFSPNSDEVAALLHKIGFKNITVKYFETSIHMNYEEAIQAFKDWTVDPRFIEKNKKDLQLCGIETPMEHVIFCNK